MGAVAKADGNVCPTEVRESRSRRVAGAVGACVATAAALTLGMLTYHRNKDYGSELSLWQDAAAKVPGNSPRLYNLGLALAGRGQYDEAIDHYQKALKIRPNFVQAENNLGAVEGQRGRFDEAIIHLQRALKNAPDSAEAHNNLGNVLVGCGRVEEAIAQYRTAIKIKPDYAEAYCNLGLALAGCGQADEAIACYRKALEIEPDYAEAHNNFGVVLGQRGRFDEAIIHLQQALKVKPAYAEAHKNLGNALSGQGKIAAAVVHWREAVRLQPKQIALMNNLAWVLATDPESSVRNGAEAVKLARRAVDLSGGREPGVLGTLAAAYAEVGRYPEAAQTARKALDVATQQNKHELAESIKAKIPLYDAKTPFWEPPLPPPPTMTRFLVW